MKFLLLLPVPLSALLMAAHFWRMGLHGLALVILLLPLALLIPRLWIARTFQVLLLIGAFEWIRTLIEIASQRQVMHQPYLRLTLILTTVAAFNLFAAALFLSKRLKQRYRYS